MLIFNGVYFSADSFPGDFGATHYAQVAYWIASVSAGEWPSWMPFAGMGYPFALNPETGILYPPFWVFPALHLPYTLKAASILQALHVFAGAVGAYTLSRRLFGATTVALVTGVAYLTYGGFYSNAAHPDIVRAFALLPWLFWALALPVSQRSALSKINLFAPLIAYFIVTGAYPGNVIAFFAAGAVFMVVQAVRNSVMNRAIRASAIDAIALFALLGLGVMIGSAYLLPIVAGAYQLTRVAGGPLSANVMHYLQPRDLLELVLPNSWLHPTDNEMYGMQLPVALFPFAAFLNRRMLWLLTPLIAVIGMSLFMAMDVFSGATIALGQHVPIFGLSRFPSGDYRALTAVGVLLVCGAGLRTPRFKRRGFVLATVVFVCAVPTLIDARTNWQVTNAENYLVNDSGLNLWPDGTWLPDDAVQRHLTERPARDSRRQYPNDVAWHAYLQRDFLMADYGGAVLTARRVVERSPELRSFMQRASTLVAIPCSLEDCSDGPNTGVTLNQDSSGFEWRLTDYGQARIQYSIYTSRPAVIVENELYADGWTARLEQSQNALAPIKIDEALRGWRLPAGEHQLTVSFETPTFGTGVACSAAGVAIYGLLITVWAIRTQRVSRPPRNGQARPGLLIRKMRWRSRRRPL